MGRRSEFERLPRDAYDTPPEAVEPLLAHLPVHVRYVEPCAGQLSLIKALAVHGHFCLDAYDIHPSEAVRPADALTEVLDSYSSGADCFITNPPWDRKILHPLIIHLSEQLPTWLLFDAEWMHTRQATPFLPRLRKVVSIGRVKWIPGTTMTGKDSCCWYLFDRQPNCGPTQFFGRTVRQGAATPSAAVAAGCS